jgi:hypothetical protein
MSHLAAGGINESSLPAENASLTLSMSTSSENLLSIDSQGRLTFVRVSPRGSSYFVEAKNAQLSDSEMAEIRSEVKRLTSEFRQFTHDFETDVTSLSEDPDEPRNGMVEAGKIALRVWLGNEAWEFYGTVPTGEGGSTIGDGLGRIGRCVETVLARATPLQSSSTEVFLLVVENPRSYFIDLPTANLLGRDVTQYMPMKPTQERIVEIASSLKNYPQPGTWQIVPVEALSKIRKIENFVAEAEFMERHLPEYSSRLPLSREQRELLAEKYEVSLTILGLPR